MRCRLIRLWITHAGSAQFLPTRTLISTPFGPLTFDCTLHTTLFYTLFGLLPRLR